MKRLPLLLVLCLSLPAGGDVIHLKDGGTLQGEIKKTDDGWLVIADGKSTKVDSDRVLSIEARPQAGADAATGRLASLRRAADNIGDIKTILDRYKVFLDQNAGTPIVKEAQADIDMWQDRLKRGLVKVGDKWVTTEERDRLQAQAFTTAADVRVMMKQGRLNEAGPLLDKALAISPQNISLQYLRGVLLYRQDQIIPARKAFEVVAAQAPDHAPTLNNLGVILWRQNAMPGALSFYDRAMLAALGSREILDNVAEALNALPEDQRKSAIAKKVVRHFTEQDDDLAKRLAEKGLRRWGATWVTAADYEKLQAAEKDIKDKLDALAISFDSVQARISRIDRLIQEDQQEMNLIDAETYGTDASGKTVKYADPPRYYDLAREIESLRAERVARLSELDRMRRDAKTIQQRLPVPKYTGLQKLIDVDGMPVQAAAAAAAGAPLPPLPPQPGPLPGPAPAPPSTSPALTDPALPAPASLRLGKQM